VSDCTYLCFILEDALEGAQGLDLYLDRSLLGWVVDYCVVRCHFELGVFPE
jgi:hypothetical protein